MSNSNITIHLLLVLLLFLLLNPFLALIILSLIRVNSKKVEFFFHLMFSVSFGFFFYFRDIGVDFYSNASDDVATYLYLFKGYYTSSFGDLFINFLQDPSGNEIGFHFFWKFWSFFTYSATDLIFLNYLFYFFIFSIFSSKISKYYFPFLILGFFFIFPISLYSIAHIWRQQMAMFVFYIAAANFFNNSNPKLNRLLIWSIPFIHLTSIYFLVLFYVFQFFEKKNKLDIKNIFKVISVFFISQFLLIQFVIRLFEYLGLTKFLGYLGGYSMDKSQFFIYLPFYIIITFIVFKYLNKNKVNNFFITVILVCLTIPFSMPQFNALYDRLINLSLPLLGLFFAKYVINSNQKLMNGLGFVLIISIGYLRLKPEYLKGEGIISFIGNGDAFNPFNSILNLLLF
jgi:hypothetical protein